MLKGAKNYTTELKLDQDLDGDPKISFKSTEGHTYTATSLDGTKRVLRKARTNFTKSEIDCTVSATNILKQWNLDAQSWRRDSILGATTIHYNVF